MRLRLIRAAWPTRRLAFRFAARSAMAAAGPPGRRNGSRRQAPQERRPCPAAGQRRRGTPGAQAPLRPCSRPAGLPQTRTADGPPGPIAPCTASAGPPARPCRRCRGTTHPPAGAERRRRRRGGGIGRAGSGRRRSAPPRWRRRPARNGRPRTPPQPRGPAEAAPRQPWYQVVGGPPAARRADRAGGAGRGPRRGGRPGRQSAARPGTGTRVRRTGRAADPARCCRSPRRTRAATRVTGRRAAELRPA